MIENLGKINALISTMQSNFIDRIKLIGIIKQTINRNSIHSKTRIDFNFV